MKRRLIYVLLLIVVAVLIVGGVLWHTRAQDDSPAAQLSPESPQLLTLWHYYNGSHQQAFDQLVLEFNETVGQQLGIVIEARSQGSVGELTRKLMASARGDFGAEPMPDIFAAYSDMAWDISKFKPLADLKNYFSAGELSEYIQAYLNEGHLAGGEALNVFPVAKSTEVLMLNRTEWYLFSAATGADVSLLETWEGIGQVSRMYYEWTDSLTPDVPDDGRAFFGLDALANYVIIGSQQLGVEMFHVEDGVATVNIDESVMRQLWDAFVVPYVNGWFAAYGSYRTDDVKTGRLAALVGSTSGAIYFPSNVTREDGTTYSITGACLPVPVFKDAQPYAVQQGAGMAVTASTPVREYAATVFLKWFTKQENNLDFCLASSYLPVKKAANQVDVLTRSMNAKHIDGMLRDSLLTSAKMTEDYTLYTTNVFDNCYAVRELVADSLLDAATNALATRKRLVAGGLDKEAAVAQLTGDAAFNVWLQSFRREVALTLAK